jgi:hypothetical protein
MLLDIREHARQIEKAVHNKEQRFILRVLRALPNTRRKLNGNVLRKVVNGFYTHSVQERDALLGFIEEVSCIKYYGIKKVHLQCLYWFTCYLNERCLSPL